MSFLRWVALVALAIWIGGLIALGAVAAPQLFAFLSARDPAGGRELAGLTFGVIFQQFQYWAWGAGVALLVSIGFRAALGPRPRFFGLRMWIAAGMLAASLATTFGVAPRIERIRSSVNGPVANLSDTDPRKAEFGRWHGISNGLMLATVLAGIALLWGELMDE